MKLLSNDQYNRVANDYVCVRAWFGRTHPDRLIAWRIMLDRQLPRHVYRVLATMRLEYWRLVIVRRVALHAWTREGTGTRNAWLDACAEVDTLMHDAENYYVEALILRNRRVAEAAQREVERAAGVEQLALFGEGAA